MNKDTFIQTVLRCAPQDAPLGFLAQLGLFADVIFDPKFDDDALLRLGVIELHRRADYLLQTALRLNATVKRTLPTIRRDQE